MKPDYMKIFIPVEKSLFQPAIKKFFSSLDHSILQFRFSEIRSRKFFKYHVVFSEPVTYTKVSDNSKEYGFNLYVRKI